MDCEYCGAVHDRLIQDIDILRFGKIVRKCQMCGTVWGITRKDRTPQEVKVDPRLQDPPENRQVFTHDPRQKGPQ